MLDMTSHAHDTRSERRIGHGHWTTNGVVMGMERLPDTPFGNPVHVVRLADGRQYQTKADSHVGFFADVFDRQGTRVHLVMENAQIIDITEEQA